MIKIQSRLRVAVLREDIVVLLGNSNEAIVLNQLCYWQERVKDVTKYIEEERGRYHNNVSNSPTEYGWIYKSAKQLSEETLLGKSENTMLNYLKSIAARGYITQRNNPKYKWDKTFQYRVNIVEILSDLDKIGYSLEGYNYLTRDVIFENKKSFFESPINKNEKANSDFCGSNDKKHSSNLKNNKAIPETITKNKTENYKESTASSEETNEVFELISKAYLQLTNKDLLSPSDEDAITDVIKNNWSTEQVIGWIKDCFKKFKPKHERDQIRSFQYIANYIFDQAAKNKKQEISSNEEYKKSNQTSSGKEYFNKFRQKGNVNWDTDCNF